MGRIIVIDGTSNAGKTTLCENIERNIKNVVERIIDATVAFTGEVSRDIALNSICLHVQT